MSSSQRCYSPADIIQITETSVEMDMSHLGVNGLMKLFCVGVKDLYVLQTGMAENCMTWCQSFLINHGLIMDLSEFV